MTTEYTVKRHKLTGKASVHFPCDKCRVEIICPLSDAGSQQVCPACGARLSVPGQVEWAAEQAAEAKRAAEQRERDQQKRREERAKQSQAAAAVVRAEQITSNKERHRPRTSDLNIPAVLFIFLGIAGIIAYAPLAVALVPGLLLWGLHRLGQEINRWGNEITDALRERDDAAD